MAGSFVDRIIEILQEDGAGMPFVYATRRGCRMDTSPETFLSSCGLSREATSKLVALGVDVISQSSGTDNNNSVATTLVREATRKSHAEKIMFSKVSGKCVVGAITAFIYENSPDSKEVKEMHNKSGFLGTLDEFCRRSLSPIHHLSREKQQELLDMCHTSLQPMNETDHKRRMHLFGAIRQVIWVICREPRH